MTELYYNMEDDLATWDQEKVWYKLCDLLENSIRTGGSEFLCLYTYQFEANYSSLWSISCKAFLRKLASKHGLTYSENMPIDWCFPYTPNAPVALERVAQARLKLLDFLREVCKSGGLRLDSDTLESMAREAIEAPDVELCVDEYSDADRLKAIDDLALFCSTRDDRAYMYMGEEK